MINRKDYEEYLIRLYFGDSNDLLDACINRAYRDLNRTIHGIDRLETKDQLYNETSGYLKKSFLDIQKDCVCMAEQEEFDLWHKSICSNLSIRYVKHGYNSFSVGQAQKWINMTFKYIFTMGENRLSGFDNLYRFCHIPLDNIILEKLKEEYGFSGLSCAWSRLDDYEEYLSCQKLIRQIFAAELPLDVEFKLWMKGKIPISNKVPLQKGTNVYNVNSGKNEYADKRFLGPYKRNRIVLCSADAGPASQAKESEAARFFPGAKWVGTVRNSANDLHYKFVILTTAHGIVNPHNIIRPYDVPIEKHKKEVSDKLQNTVPTILGGNQYDLLWFYAGGCPRDVYMELFLPILRDLKIDFITFGRPNMFDIGKIKVIAEMLEKGASMDDLKSKLKCPERLIFVSWQE